jgi:hypothetical protein
LFIGLAVAITATALTYTLTRAETVCQTGAYAQLCVERPLGPDHGPTTGGTTTTINGSGFISSWAQIGTGNYTNLDYIQFDAAQQSYIDLGASSRFLTTDNSIKFTLDVAFLRTDTTTTDGNGLTALLAVNRSGPDHLGTTNIVAVGRGGGASCPGISTGGWTACINDQSRNNIYVEVDRVNSSSAWGGYKGGANSQAATSSATADWRSVTIGVSRNNSSGAISNFATEKVYGATISKNSALTLDLKPAQRNSDGQCGLLDTLTDTFYANAGSGTITCGTPQVDSYTDGTATYYKQPYLEFNGGQYIDTGVDGNDNLNVFVDFQLTANNRPSGDTVVWGTYNSSLTQQCELRLAGTAYGGWGGYCRTDFKTFSPNIDYSTARLQYQKTGTTATMGGSTITGLGIMTGNPRTIWLGGLNYSGTFTTPNRVMIGKVYSFAIDKDDPADDRNFVPVCDFATGTGGMFDTLHNRFYPSDSGQAFTCPTPSVTFDGQPAEITQLTDTVITVKTPPHAVGVVDVAVTANGVTTTLPQSFTYQPQITTIVPNVGPTAGGNTVTVYGKGFGPPAGSTQLPYLEFNGTQYINTGVDQTGNVKITTELEQAILTRSSAFGSAGNAAGTNSCLRFVMHETGAIQYCYGSGSGAGTQVNIGQTYTPGTRYEVAIDNKQVYVDGSLKYTSPAGAPTNAYSMFIGAANLAGSPGLMFEGKFYFFQIDKDDPADDRNFIPLQLASGDQGMWDTLHSCFYKNDGSAPDCYGVAEITIDGVSCGNVVVLSDTQLTCQPAAHAAGTVAVDGAVNGVAASLPSGGLSYTYREPMSVSSVQPAQGPVNGGTAVTITGNNFLPFDDGYLPLEYLNFTGSQYINTGVLQTGVSKVKIGYQINSTTNNQGLFGVWDTATAANNFHIRTNVSNIRFDTNTVSGGAGATIGQDYELEYEKTATQDILRIDGAQVATKAPLVMVDSIEMKLGAASSHTGGVQYERFRGRIYGFQVWDGSGVPVRDFVPVKQLSDGACGMYDLMSRSFYGAASGSFPCDAPADVTVELGTAAEIASGTGAACSSVVVVSNTEITCVTAAHAVGDVGARVANDAEGATLAVGSGWTADGTHGFRYLAAPSVSVATTAQTHYVASGGSFVLAGALTDTNPVSPAGYPLAVCATINAVEKCANYTSGGAVINYSLSWTAAELGDGTYDFSTVPLSVVVKNTTAINGASVGDINANGLCETSGLTGNSVGYGELCAAATWAGTVVVDSLPPSLTITPAGSASWTNTQPLPDVAAAVSGGSGLSEVRYSWDVALAGTCESGGTEIAHTSTAGMVSLAAALGTHTLYACARDAAGNVATASETYNWENIAPETAGVSWSPSQAPWNDGSAGVTFSLVGYSDSGGSGLASSNNYSCVTGTGNGDTCQVTVYDNAGNSTVFTSPPNRVATVGPTIDITNPADGSWLNSASYWTNTSPTPQIDVTDLGGSDIARIAYAWSAGGLNAGCSNGTAVANGAVLAAPPQGANVLYVCAVDNAGNVTTTFAGFNWETVAPTCTGWSPSVAPWNRGQGVTFMPTGCADSGGSGLVNPGTCTTSGANGATCNVTVVDNAGNALVLSSPPDNVDAVGPSLDFVDATGPSFVESGSPLVAKIKLSPNLAPVVQWRYSLTPFPIDDVDGSSVCTGGVEVDLSLPPYDAGDFSLPLDLGDVPAGGFKVYACAEDMAGNIVFGQAEYNWRRPAPPEAPGTGLLGRSREITISMFSVVISAVLIACIGCKIATKRRNRL